MQSDGNLVVYKSGGGPSSGGALWSTGTWGHTGAYATLQNDGNFIVYKSGGSPSTGGASIVMCVNGETSPGELG
ncbi:hypothetical protein ACIQB5_15525 [Streptomyces sp. NPDC088560]|uniref:hypothetical protein n=1 Tax=Streptomyces sp. NPDC088560 TaxID=3365868 RepID=UPI0037FAC095